MREPLILEREQCFPQPRAELFAFFANPANLERITPPFLSFRILTPLPIQMRPGARFDYRLRLHGLPVSWQTCIDAFDAPDSFVDRQVAGPYRLWHHTHTFEDIPGGTRMRDVVRYRLPFGPLGRLVHALWVRRTLRRIFDDRESALVEVFGSGGERRGAR